MEKIRKKILAAGEIFGLSTTEMPPNLFGVARLGLFVEEVLRWY